MIGIRERHDQTIMHYDKAWAETKTGNELEPFNKIQVFMKVKDTLQRGKVKKALSQVGLKKYTWQNKGFGRDLHTNILDKINPGINPASKGTRAVANDQVNTPILRTFLNPKKKNTGEHDPYNTLTYMPENKDNIFLVCLTSTNLFQL